MKTGARNETLALSPSGRLVVVGDDASTQQTREMAVGKEIRNPRIPGAPRVESDRYIDVVTK